MHYNFYIKLNSKQLNIKMSANNEQYNNLTYKYYFKEDDDKSRLFDDTEEDLLSKLTVININI